MKAKARNIIGWAIITAGFIFAFGAVGESDMYEEMGEFLSLMVTMKKITLGLGVMFLGMIVKED